MGWLRRLCAWFWASAHCLCGCVWPASSDWLLRWRLWFAERLLVHVDGSRPHVKNWRPQLLLLSREHGEDMGERVQLLRLAEQLKAGKGLAVAVTLVPLDGRPFYGDAAVDAQLNAEECRIAKAVGAMSFNCHTVACPYTSAANVASAAIQSTGVSVLTPNTVVARYPADLDSMASLDGGGASQANYWRVLHSVDRSPPFEPPKTLVVLKGDFPKPSEQIRGTIDLWWIVHDGGMMLMLGVLLRRHRVWAQCRLRVFVVVKQEDAADDFEAKIREFLWHARTPFDELRVLSLPDDEIGAFMLGRDTHAAPLSKQAAVNASLSPPVAAQPDTAPWAARSGSGRSHGLLPRHIAEHSAASELVVVNLPQAPVRCEDMGAFGHFLAALSQGIPRALFIRGTTEAVITIYS